MLKFCAAIGNSEQHFSILLSVAFTWSCQNARAGLFFVFQHAEVLKYWRQIALSMSHSLQTTPNRYSKPFPCIGTLHSSRINHTGDRRHPSLLTLIDIAQSPVPTADGDHDRTEPTIGALEFWAAKEDVRGRCHYESRDGGGALKLDISSWRHRCVVSHCTCKRVSYADHLLGNQRRWHEAAAARSGSGSGKNPDRSLLGRIFRCVWVITPIPLDLLLTSLAAQGCRCVTRGWGAGCSHWKLNMET